MKKLLILLFILNSITAFSQTYTQQFTISRNRITKSGMNVLGGWGLANAAAGISGWIASEDLQHKRFYQMTTIWGAVDIGAAIIGFTKAQKDVRQQQSAVENLKAQTKIEKTFLINGGLDVAYIGTGILLNNSGNAKNNATLKGYGSSVIIQGAFLLLFDGTMYILHRSNGNKFKHLLQ